jgi:adenine-specific DNA methylase
VADATAANWPDVGGFDVVMTDPPYFDYIAYSDLSMFFRVWLDASGLSTGKFDGKPLYSGSESKDAFAERLGESLQRVSAHLKPDGLVAFTYHASTREGWWAAVAGVRAAGLTITAAFPVWADAKSPGHGHAGNIEYDVVFCCRPAGAATPAKVSAAAWEATFQPEGVPTADLASWSLACEEINAEPIDMR